MMMKIRSAPDTPNDPVQPTTPPRNPNPKWEAMGAGRLERRVSGWAERLGRRFMAFALYSFRRNTIAPTALLSVVYSVLSVV